MRRVTAIALAIGPLLYSGAVLLYFLLIASFQCDEGCQADSPYWVNTEGAWQWRAIGAIGVATFAAGIAYFVSVVARRPRAALASLAVGAATTVAPILWLEAQPDPAGATPQSYGFVLLISAAAIAAGLLAVRLARSRT